MNCETAAGRAAVLLEQIGDIDAWMPGLQQDVDRVVHGGAFDEQSVRKLAS